MKDIVLEAAIEDYDELLSAEAVERLVKRWRVFIKYDADDSWSENLYAFLDFAAENGDRAALIYGGRIVSVDEATRFFAANDYYTTAAARMTRPFFKTAVTANRAAELCAESGFRHE